MRDRFARELEDLRANWRLCPAMIWPHQRGEAFTPHRDRPRRRFSPTRFISRGRCLWFLWSSQRGGWTL